MIVSSLLLAAATFAPMAGNRVWFGDLEVRGPSAGFVVRQADGGTTELAEKLLAGETRRVPIPLSIRPLGGTDPVFVIEPHDAGLQGDARWIGWSSTQPSERWERLPRGLRARPRPPGGEPHPRPGPAALSGLALACLCALLIGTRRAGLALAAGALFGGVAAVVPISVDGGAQTVTEYSGSSGRGLKIQSAAGPVEFDAERVASIESSVEGATLHFRQVPAPVGGGVLAGRWAASAARGGVTSFAAGPAGGFELSRERNGGPSLELTWTRDSSGRWLARGPWRSGEALPDPVPGAEPPPAWLAGGLPQGVSVLVGLVEGPSDSAWVRWTEFP